MKKVAYLLLLAGVMLLAVTASNRSMAGDFSGQQTIQGGMNGLPPYFNKGSPCDWTVDYDCDQTKASIAAAKAEAKHGQCDPYVNFKCLDAYLGDDPVTRLFRYYQLEWGHATAPADPTAPPSRKPDAIWPPTPQSSPPMPFTEWPYGGTDLLGVNRTASVDSPLMVAIANTATGKWMAENGIQVYGWAAPGGNLSTNTVRQGGNFPVSYDYTPNVIQLDQAVVYFERTPDTVQTDHVDWGFRVAPIYGVDYRYTYAYGVFSGTLNKQNLVNGFDVPMAYADLYVPQVMDGLMLRLGRFISIPDIEAQLAPNNYTYAHSLTYTWDNYTNTGLQANVALTKNFILQLGLTVGTEAMPWHWGDHIPNPYPNTAATPNPLYPGTTMLKDPGAQPSGTVGLRWTSDDGRDDLTLVGDAWNQGQYGYNNLQWVGFTYYHKFNDYWHFSFETYNEHSYNVPNSNNPLVQTIYANSGEPFGPLQVPFNGPNLAACGGSLNGNTTELTCTADAQSFLLYVNYSPDKLNNISLRTEFYMDPEGWRTGVATNYADVALGWQHWLSPQIELRPEIGYYRSLTVPAFNGNSAEGIAPSRDWAVIAASDIIIHF
jgi:hypothetical protein